MQRKQTIADFDLETVLKTRRKEVAQQWLLMPTRTATMAS
jgi:hypothetical protein